MRLNPNALLTCASRAITVACALVVASACCAEPYPTSPIRLIVAFAAGGGTDSIARPLALALSARLGQPVVVDNKPGAGGSIGTATAASSAPDGYTFVLGSNGTMVLNPLLYPNIKYQVERDFQPVAGIASIPYLIAANANLKATDIRTLITLGKSQKLTFASPGNGTTNHLVGVLLESMSKVDMTHVPYRGASLAMNDVVSGQVNFLSGDLATLMPMVNAGKLRPLAVTSAQRTSALPNVPTVAESGFTGFEASGWFALFAPKGTPQVIIERVSKEVTAVLAETRVQKRMLDIGGVPMQLNADQVGAMVKSETAKWRKVIVDNRVTADSLQ